MSRRSFPRIEPNALRDHADEARVDRVWERIDNSVAARLDRRRGGRSMVAYVAIAAALGAFAGGVFVGKAWHRPAALPAEPVAAPAPEKSRIEVLAAGSQLRTFPLEGSGDLTLSPGATAEVERSGSALTVSLLQGMASIKASGRRPMTVVAGEARINTQAGSVLSVKRNVEDLEVRVDDGVVDVTAPDGTQQQFRKGEGNKAVPLHTAITSARDEAAPRRNQPSRLPQRARGPVVKGVAQPEWLARWQGNDGEGALAAVRKQGVDQVIAQARSANELMDLADLMRHSARDQAAAARAYRRVVDSFKGDQRVSIAANYLADYYQGLGEAALAQQYRDTAKLHATMADALFCNLIEQHANKAEAAGMAMEYLRSYPHGQCHERAKELVDAAQPAGDAPAPSTPPAPAAPPAGQ